MKTIIVIILIAGVSYFLFTQMPMGKSIQSTSTPDTIQYEMYQIETPINMVYFQDVTGSITQNGVEIINSSVFAPYYNAIHRDIQLSFGVINGRTARKLIPLVLKATRLKKPILPDFEKVSFELKNDLKRKYAEANLKYQNDSNQFYSNRKKSFSEFCQRVDSAVNPYRTKLSDTTDLMPALQIADRVFNYSFSTDAIDYLLLNTDGLDTYKRQPEALKNKATVILINANGLTKTNIDNVVTKTLESTEQAIELTLNNHN